MKTETVSAYPLAWPRTKKREHCKEHARFSGRDHGGRTRELTINEATNRLQSELDKLGATDYVLSTNLELRLDGAPRSGQTEPLDSGAALYFTLLREPHCLACDRWSRVADNVAAIAKHIEAMRGMERWGVGDRKAMFTGFRALPEPGATKHWSDVLGVSAQASFDEAKAAWKRRVSISHPDRSTGHDETAAEINSAWYEAQKDIESRAT